MKPKKAIIAATLTVGVCISSIPAIKSYNYVTGSHVAESHSIIMNVTKTELKGSSKRPVIDYIDVFKNPSSYSWNERINAGYAFLKDNNIDIKDISNYLENLIVYYNNPMCLTDKECELVLGPLSKVPQMVNSFEAFYPLAYYYHTLSCELPHENSTCFYLNSLWNEIGPKYEDEIMEENFKGVYAYEKIKLALNFNPDLCMQDYISELIALSSISKDSPISQESLEKCFPNLSLAVGAGETLLETFYDLGVQVNNLMPLYNENSEDIHR